MTLFRDSTFCIVTGASRGLGKEIAILLAKEWSKAGADSDIVLTGRDFDALTITKSVIITQTKGITVHIVSGDLEDMETLPALCSHLLKPIDRDRHRQSLLVNNAGTLGDCDMSILAQNDPTIIQNYFGTNVTSMIVLTTRFLSALLSSPQYVVNITSLLASHFVQGYQLYSPSRAARNAFMGVLGAEMPSVRLLNYSPGPMDTDMFKEIPEKFRVADRGVLRPVASAKKLVGILQNDTYDSGAIIDFFDDET